MTTERAVLLVEDDDVYREQIHRLLDEDCRLVDAVYGREALERVEQEPFDCVLLDHGLPDQTGLDLLPLLRQRGLPVVMLTAAGSEQVAVRAIKRGCHDYLVKRDLTRDLLTRTIHGAIDREALARAKRQKQDALDAFVSTAAHDLKAPLRHVTLFCDFALEAMNRGNLDEAKESLETAQGAAKRLHGLVEALLGYTRLGSADREPAVVDLGAILKILQVELEPELEALGGRLEVGAMPTVTGDEALLGQVISNLITNAIKFRSDAPLVIRVDAEQDEEEWCISIRDNGIGIPANFFETVFEPLRRLHSQSEIEGHGIGLATCRRVVEKHGGRIWVESTEGEGSAFRFTLPTGAGGISK